LLAYGFLTAFNFEKSYAFLINFHLLLVRLSCGNNAK
jgi:hypothetical protein